MCRLPDGKVRLLPVTECPCCSALPRPVGAADQVHDTLKAAASCRACMQLNAVR